MTIPDYCKGERCACGQPAVRKIEVSSEPTDGWHTQTFSVGHPLTAYICERHFVELFGAGARRLFPKSDIPDTHSFHPQQEFGEP